MLNSSVFPSHTDNACRIITLVITRNKWDDTLNKKVLEVLAENNVLRVNGTIRQRQKLTIKDFDVLLWKFSDLCFKQTVFSYIVWTDEAKADYVGK